MIYGFNGIYDSLFLLLCIIRSIEVKRYLLGIGITSSTRFETNGVHRLSSFNCVGNVLVVGSGVDVRTFVVNFYSRDMSRKCSTSPAVNVHHMRFGT